MPAVTFVKDPIMGKLSFMLIAAAGMLAVAAGPASAAQALPSPGLVAADVVPVAEGCGWGRWRGPWGGCRGSGWSPPPAYYGPGLARSAWNGCPPGFWRGPWGHCRDTPYHGALPGGGYR
jgi:hypothetical protein